MHKSGITDWRHSPGLNTKQSFIDDLAHIVADALNELSQSIMEACKANNVGRNLALKSVSWHREISSAGVSGVRYDDDRNVIRAYQQRLCIVFYEGYVFVD